MRHVHVPAVEYVIKRLAFQLCLWLYVVFRRFLLITPAGIFLGDTDIFSPDNVDLQLTGGSGPILRDCAGRMSRSLPAALRTKALRQLGGSRNPSAALEWVPWDAVIMLTGFLLSCEGPGEPFYWPLRQSKTKHVGAENWVLMNGNPIVLWFSFSSAKYDCFCSPAAWLTEAWENIQREVR